MQVFGVPHRVKLNFRGYGGTCPREVKCVHEAEPKQKTQGHVIAQDRPATL